jgi:5-formyltetrahydrofolate cyclo-ligase
MVEMDAAELRAWRAARRAHISAARAALAHEERRTASAAIDAHLDALFAEARGVVAVYWPIHDEFDVRPFVARLRAKGATPALPVVIAKGQPLEFRAWREDEPLATGAFGIRYPAAGAVLAPAAFVVPLLGFDEAGFRLGHGAGYYDRTLAGLEPKPLVVGVGFACGRLATIHPQPHDVPMDAIVTEAGVIRTAR